MKIYKIILSVLFLTCSASVFATAPSHVFDEIYMTSGNGTYDVRDTFGWDETPWIYFKMPTDPNNFHFGIKAPSNDKYKFLDKEVGSEFWVSLDNLFEDKDGGSMFSWDDIKEVGLWDLDAQYASLGSSAAGKGDLTFTITPEPISSLLFLIGGGALVAIRRKV